MTMVFPFYLTLLSQIPVVWLSCDICFFTVLIYVLFIRECKVINQIKTEHLLVHDTLAHMVC